MMRRCCQSETSRLGFAARVVVGGRKHSRRKTIGPRWISAAHVQVSSRYEQVGRRAYWRCSRCSWCLVKRGDDFEPGTKRSGGLTRTLSTVSLLLRLSLSPSQQRLPSNTLWLRSYTTPPRNLRLQMEPRESERWRPSSLDWRPSQQPPVRWNLRWVLL